MYLSKEKLQHISTIAHEGKVVVLATDAEGKIWYTVKQDGFEDSYLNTPAELRTGFEAWKELALPDENDDRSVIDKEIAELTDKNNPSQFIIRSRYKSKNESAIAPVQLISGVGHLYVFRQSKSNTLLVDRFVLDGITNELTRKLEVRFKRSRQKYKASEKMKMGAGGLQNVDSLDYRDTDNKFFYEPTTELCLINNLVNGWFSVVQVPTNEHEKYRWHIFAYNSQTKKVELTTIRASEEGLFDVKDYPVLEAKSKQDETLVPRSIPGVIKRSIEISGVTVKNGLSATKYDLQQEKETSAKDSEGKPIKQLLRTDTKVMLAIPTDKGTAALSFAIASDGTLSQIDETPENKVIRSFERDVLLPLNTLEAIKAIADTTPPALGTVTGFAVGTDDAEDLVVVTAREAGSLEDGDMVKLKNVVDFNGLYKATKVDKDTFIVDIASTNGLGNWEKIEAEEGGLFFDGAIVSYQKNTDGKLLINAINHGLETGDEVQIVGTQAYNDSFPVRKIDDTQFVIERRWIAGEAVNVKLESMKRRGIVFDGQDDYIELELPSKSFPAGNEITVSFWAKGGTTLPKQTVVLEAIDRNNQRLFVIHLPWSDSNIYFDCGSDGQNFDRINKSAQPTEYKGEWCHWAFTKNAATGEMKIYRNGVLWHQDTGKTKPIPEAAKVKIGAFVAENSAYYEGTLADFRIWNKALTQTEIKNGMYLELTGKEVGLIGYWRLGAISEGTERKVVDFSFNANDGIVYGGAYVGNISLSRTLRDGTTPAVKYSNMELFAVSQRSTYIEEFEFKVNGNVDVNNADGTGNKIFQLTYWGKSSRSAEDIISISAVPDDFQNLNNGWYRAACRFIVPDGIAMVRSFEISNVKGTWNTLEIRKHRIRLISDAITKAEYSDGVSLTPLADNYAGLLSDLRGLEQKELEEIALLVEKIDLEDKLAALANLEQTRTTVQSLKATVQRLSSEKQTLQSKYDEQVNSPFNYTCYIQSRGTERWQYISYSATEKKVGLKPAGQDPSWEPWQRWKFVAAAEAGWYYIQAKSGEQCQYIYISSTDKKIGVLPAGQDPSWQKWKFVAAAEAKWYYIQAKSGEQCQYIYYSPTDVRIGLLPAGQDPSWQQWNLQKTEEVTNNNISNALQEFNSKEEELRKTQAELAKLQEVLDRGDAQKSVWQQRLSEIIAQLFQVQQAISTLNTNFINAVKTNQQKPQTMSQLAKDAKGLVTRGALLGFVCPASRLNAIETCEGNVQLSYFDDKGQMRQTIYDATSDSLNTTFEQWIPDGVRTCANLNNSRSVIKLNQSLYLGENYTVEAWFAYPFGDRLQWRILATSEDDSQQIVTYNEKQLGICTNGYFHDCGYNLELLSRGWHHLAICTKDKASYFYIDGKKVGETPSQSPLAFDGENDYVSLPLMKVDFSKGFTVEAWVLYNDFSTQWRIVDLGTVSGLNNIFLDNVNGSKKLRLSVTNGSTTKQVETGEVLEIGKWMHLAATIDSDGNVTLYKNGQAIATNKGILPSNTTVDWTQNIIGKSKWQQDSIYNGQIAEVRLWNIRRTQSEIQASFGQTLTGNEVGLVGYWKFANGEAKDRSAKQYNGTIQGKPKAEPLAAAIQSNVRAIGNFNKQAIANISATLPTAIQLDGIDDYIEIPAHTNTTDAITVSLWAKSQTATWNENGFFVSKRDAFVLHPNVGGKSVNFYLFSKGAWQSASFNPNIDITQWHHYAGTFDGAAIRLYIDGVEVARTNFAGKINADTGVMCIGRDDGIARYFNGQIAEVQIWNKACTQTEIQATMGKIIAGSEAGLTGYWRLTDGSAKDYSSNGRNGTIFSSPQVVPYSVKVTIASQANSALKFDGVDDFISFPAMNVDYSQGFSVEAWVNYDSFKNWSRIIDFGIGAGRDNLILANLETTNTLVLSIRQGTTEKQIQVGGALPTNQWIHLAVSIDAAGNSKIYKDGQEIASGAAGRPNNVNRTTNYIGKSNWAGDGYFNGSLAEIRVWNKVRTPGEIQADRAKVLTGSEANLVGYWRLSDGSAKDYSIYGRNGTINSNPTKVNFDKVQTQLVQITTDSTAKQSSPSNQFGKLAEIRFWNLALSDEEIAVNSKTLLSGNEPGLVAYYPINEATGNEIRDYSGNNRHAVMDGASWWACAAPIGKLSNSQQVIQFGGAIDYIITASPLTKENLSSFTLEAWVKFSSAGENMPGPVQLFGQESVVSIYYYCEPSSTGELLIASKDGADFLYVQYPSPYVGQGWHHIAVVVANGGNGFLYLDGIQVATGSLPTQSYGNSSSPFQMGALVRQGVSYQPFCGKMTEVRFWKVARSQAEIQAKMNQRLTGKEQGLVSYWRLDEIKIEGSARKVLDLAGNNHGTVNEAIALADNTLPIGGDAVVSCEYSTVTIDPVTKRKSAIMRRFFASPVVDGVEVLPDKRIETLVLQWIGNAQFAPTLLGYIEGAPPIPTENLTVQPDYNGATSVELTMSEDVEFSWNRSQDFGLGASVNLFLGADTQLYAGLGVMAKTVDVRAGFQGNLNTSYQFMNETNITSSSSTSMTDKLSLRGTPEQTAKFPHLGTRFIPKNIGYALVISSLADVFVSKLARSGRMVGYQVQPVDGIPPDVNTITFLINPAYTMNGSLDGMTGSSATSDRFFRHVPEMRSQYGSLYPASYYRLREAYDLKQAIEQEDKRRESYFMQFNVRVLGEGALDSQINTGAAPGSISVAREEDKPATTMTDEEKKAAEQARLEQLKKESADASAQQSAAAKQKKAEIEAKIADQQKQAHATDSFAAWQKRMEDIQIRAGKRNIVNTYVWDADGGLRTEAQSFANTAQHTIGGSFTLDAGLGGEIGIGAGVKVELTALATVNMTQTMTKTEARSKGIQLNVDLSGVESVGITDYNDYPIQPGEKVDRYRFMSFYLDGSTNNFYDFFNYVVDPEWLRSNDEEARALRGARGKANKAWRVLHRVTYVERPALMGFGRDLRQSSDLDRATAEILAYFKELESRHQELKAKLDRVLNMMNNQ